MENKNSQNLLALAKKQEEFAKKYCKDDCYSYHLSWSYLRAANLVGGVESDKEQILTLLKPLLLSDKKLNILIAGSADTGLYSLLLPFVNSNHTITLVDRCSTPLNSCKEITPSGINFKVSHSDLLNYEPKKKFDIILCHSILVFFSDEDREKLLKNFSSWLSSDGSLIIASRLKTNIHDENININNWIEEKKTHSLSELTKKINFSIEGKEELSFHLNEFYKITSILTIPYSNKEEIINEFKKCNLTVKEALKAGKGKSYISSKIQDYEKETPSGFVVLANKVNI